VTENETVIAEGDCRHLQTVIIHRQSAHCLSFASLQCCCELGVDSSRTRVHGQIRSWSYFLDCHFFLRSNEVPDIFALGIILNTPTSDVAVKFAE